MAEFKAEFINSFVSENAVESVIEFGCGDGNQLSLAEYPRYVGLDVSATAISICMQRFQDDPTKSFFMCDPNRFVDNHRIFRADLALSLDVVFHLIEDDVYEAYMRQLFHAATRFVIIYSSSQDDDGATAAHVRHREFTSWIVAEAPEWALSQKAQNPYPFAPDQPDETSPCDMYVFTRL